MTGLEGLREAARGRPTDAYLDELLDAVTDAFDDGGGTSGPRVVTWSPVTNMAVGVDPYLRVIRDHEGFEKLRDSVVEKSLLLGFLATDFRGIIARAR